MALRNPNIVLPDLELPATDWKPFSRQASPSQELDEMQRNTEAKTANKPARKTKLSDADRPAHKVFPPKGRRMTKKQLAILLKPITELTD